MSLNLRVALMVVAMFLPGLGSGGVRGQRSAQRSTPAGLVLLHKMQDSLGGARRIAAVSDVDETIRAQAWDERGTALGEVRKRTRWMQHPSTLRLDQIGPRGAYVLYFDGGSKSGWEILPDLTGSRSPTPTVRFRRRCATKGWRTFAGVRFATSRVKYLSGMKRGEVTSEALHVNVGLTPEALASKPADFAPDIDP